MKFAQNLVFLPVALNFHRKVILVCNFTCHEKCLNTVASFCSGVAMQLIKNPVAHCWSEPGYIKRRFCCVCRKKTDDILSVECEVCEYYVHVFCQDLAVSDCKEAGTFIGSLEPATQKQHHHWREGNLPAGSKCAVCRKTCWSAECLAGMRCEWCCVTVSLTDQIVVDRRQTVCDVQAHAICYRQISPDCDFGVLRQIMLPPNCLTAPRTELPMEQLLSIKCRDKDPSTPPNVQIPEDSGSSTNEETGRDKEDCKISLLLQSCSSIKQADQLSDICYLYICSNTFLMHTKEI
ncbi:unnamed protein product [Soboliphyme baturini]|uniref:Diacylglycerol kinase theta n=1 Tax=Soboliphyme baturini TaxID=241478 RepID=A0A183IEH5_9BILA|nr:unnamed protein product [Soboliphyme baturini]